MLFQDSGYVSNQTGLHLGENGTFCNRKTRAIRWLRKKNPTIKKKPSQAYGQQQNKL